MSSPIEQYLGQLQSKLESRFDSECACQLLSEIRSHLYECAADLEEDGADPIEAEKISIQRFDAPEKAAFLLPLGQQFGTGDRYWGWGAFAAATIAALGIAGYAFSDVLQMLFSKDELKPLLTATLLFYAYACWRARTFSMLRQSAAVVAIIVMATGMLGASSMKRSPSNAILHRPARPLYAQAELSPNLSGISGGYLPSLVADLGIPKDHLLSGAEGAYGPSGEDEKKALKVPGMAPIGQSPWDLTQEGLLPEASRLLLSWLFLVLMANAAVCWVGCLEHEQKNGVALLQ